MLVERGNDEMKNKMILEVLNYDKTHNIKRKYKKRIKTRQVEEVLPKSANSRNRRFDCFKAKLFIPSLF